MKLPLSTVVCPSGSCRAWRLAGTRLRCRSSARSSFISRAALSIRRFQNVDGLGEPGPAGDADWDGVGRHRADTQVKRGNAIDGVRKRDVLADLNPAGRTAQIRADIRPAPDAQCKKGPPGIERQFRIRHVVAGLMVGDESRAPVVDPFDRPVHLARGPEHEDVFDVGEILAAEPAADIRGDKAQAVLRNAQRRGDVVTPGMDALARDMQRVAVRIAIEHADRAARLHRVGDDAMVAEVEPRHMRRFREGARRCGVVTHGPFQDDVARNFLAQQYGAVGQRCLRRRYGRHGFVIDVNPFRRVAGLGGRPGDDEGDRLAYMAHPVGRERRIGREGEGLTGILVRPLDRGQRADVRPPPGPCR